MNQTCHVHSCCGPRPKMQSHCVQHLDFGLKLGSQSSLDPRFYGRNPSTACCSTRAHSRGWYCFRELRTNHDGRDDNSPCNNGAPVRIVSAFLIIFRNATARSYFRIFFFIVPHLSATESDPFHQNDELDKIPGLH